MQATLRLPRAATYPEYLAVERASEHRHELIDGVIVAMAGGSDEHNALSGKLAMLLGVRLEGGCRYFSPDQRFWIAKSGRSRYSDGSIIWGKPEHPSHDDQASINPVVVVEVLSPTSAGDDDGDKRLDFQSLPSLEAYVLVSQDARLVKVYRRAGADWVVHTHTAGDELALPAISSAIGVGEIYDGILDEAGRSLLR